MKSLKLFSKSSLSKLLIVTIVDSRSILITPTPNIRFNCQYRAKCMRKQLIKIIFWNNLLPLLSEILILSACRDYSNKGPFLSEISVRHTFRLFLESKAPSGNWRKIMLQKYLVMSSPVSGGGDVKPFPSKHGAIPGTQEIWIP